MFSLKNSINSFLFLFFGWLLVNTTASVRFVAQITTAAAAILGRYRLFERYFGFSSSVFFFFLIYGVWSLELTDRVYNSNQLNIKFQSPHTKISTLCNQLNEEGLLGSNLMLVVMMRG